MVRALRLAVPVVAVAAATLLNAVGAAQVVRATTVGPGQMFRGQVNGSSGAHAPVVIRMACAGPIQPGQTGHPMSGQTVGVVLIHAVYPRSGHTGPQTTSIGAFFNGPPPSTRSSGSGYVSFTRYRTRALPTSLTLPCSGTGTVYFVPLPTVPGGSAATVPVSFVGQP